MIRRLIAQSICELSYACGRAVVVLGLAALDGWLVWLDAAIAGRGM